MTDLRLSAAQRKILIRIRDGHSPYPKSLTAPQRGSITRTLHNLSDRHMIGLNPHYVLREAGRDALEAKS